MLRIMALVLVCSFLPAARADTLDELLQQAKRALERGDAAEAVKLADKIIEKDGKNVQGHFYRGLAHDQLGKHAEAVADFTRLLESDPKFADAYDRRGSSYFKLGKFKESLADFDQYLKLKPKEKNGHWRRGITCYYAGKFDEGRKQFEGYEKVDTNDVENAVWHFLCLARAEGVEKARKALLKIGNDPRVPMTQVYDLFAGKAKLDEVLEAVEKDKPTKQQLTARLFYAHLYLGLYHEVSGDPKKALEHMKEAEKHKVDHYMWDVARVHRELLEKK